jgi:hypothetical protein
VGKGFCQLGPIAPFARFDFGVFRNKLPVTIHEFTDCCLLGFEP